MSGRILVTDTPEQQQPQVVSVLTRFEFGKIPFDQPKQLHLMVTLEGAKLTLERKPLGIGVAIDCSGSMQGDKIDFAKKSLLTLVDHMTEQDCLGIIGFSDNVFDVFGPKKMTAKAKDVARSEIKKLRSMSATNLSGATLKSYDVVKDALEGMGRLNGQVLRALLFTDGQPTTGVCDPPSLVKMAGQKPEYASLSTFGYGVDHDPKLLADMAKAGAGNFYFVQTPDKCAEFFGREIGGLLSCVAQNIKLQIKAAPGVKILSVLNDLKSEVESDSATIMLDDVYSDERRKVVLKLELPEKSKAVAVRASKVCDVSAEFFDIKATEKRTSMATAKIDYVKEEDAQKKPDTDVTEQIAILDAAKAQLKAKEYADAGNFRMAQEVMTGGIMRLQAVGTDFADQAAYYMSNAADAVQGAQCYQGGGEAMMVSGAEAFNAGRGYSIGSAKLFSTPLQKKMAASFADTKTKRKGK